MNYRIESYSPEQADAVVALSLRAWAPVFVSLADSLDTEVFREFYPKGWQVSQEQSVREAFSAADAVWVAVCETRVLAFAAVKLHREDRMGELQMLAVDPEAQGQGVGRALTQLALQWMKDSGMSIAMVETGGDEGHAPARRTYERAGFRIFPVARYFKRL
jgi:GNAT superfamily N-acetyltransferase